MTLSHSEAEDWERERRMAQACAKTAAEVDKWKALCRQLAAACQYNRTFLLENIGQKTHALALSESGLEAAKKAGMIDAY